ncbi:TetR/AcrR family transcriptional regulator [Kribbella sandramycini]|uniref:AcrR family transcriptional regulator n=1 Tax=Kribbella sandramycini TaxID=60450 RepID=A0A841SCH4_9ACTN|nr:TetR/AcrR family transcriptional regulator [Kribbella sandramycini]MBB6567731.1 AcrR family transcriptional regulator [Kribbella sandramycini]
MAPEDRRVTSRQLAAEETRRRLLAAALEQFSRRPFNEVTVSEIAQTAGVAYGLLFHHFGSKRALYLEALGEGARQLELAHVTDLGAPPGERIRQLFRSHLQHLADNPELALMLVLDDTAGSDAWEAFEPARRHAVDWACRQLDLDPHNDSIRMMWCSFTSAGDAAAAQWLRTGRCFPIDAVVESLINILIGALDGAQQLDPHSEVEAAIKLLRDPSATPA